MSISIMGEGDTMGRGIPPDPKIQAEIRRRTMLSAPEQVIIFGAGPAGMLAAHAVALAGREPVIISAPSGEPFEEGLAAKSKIGGATYLHSAIPDATSADPDAMIRFSKTGTREGYALKVYGDPHHPTSWDKFEGEHPGWSLQPVYDDLWRRYAERIIPMKVDDEVVRDFLKSHPVVISTIPPSSFCTNPEHQFPRRKIWVLDQHYPSVQPNEIVYDGLVGAVGGRYRSSLLFGRGSTEFAEGMPLAVEGFKVLTTDCDCFPDVMRVGRFGKWQPGVLVDHAFQEVWNAMWDNFEGA